MLVMQAFFYVNINDGLQVIMSQWTETMKAPYPQDVS